MPLGFQRLSGKGVLDQVIEGLWSTSAMAACTSRQSGGNGSL
jgi:hypothetical protein